MEKWQHNLRAMFVVTTIVAIFCGAIVVGARRFHYGQVRQVRTVLDDYPEIERVWIGTNDDVQLEVEQVFFTVNGQDAIFRSGGIDYVGEAEFRRRLDQSLQERQEVQLPDYATPLDR